MFDFIRSSFKVIITAFLVFVAIGIFVGVFLVNQANQIVNPRAPDLFDNGAAPAPVAVTAQGPEEAAPASTPPNLPVSTGTTGPAGGQVGPIAGGCSEGMALTCLPRSSAPVVFINPAAANRAAWANLQNGYSTSIAEADAISDGATGKAARLCGIIQSNDSSPLAKHLAAIRLDASNPTDGRASDPCLKFADNFL